MMVIWARIKAVWKHAVVLAPAVLAGVSAYYLFLVIAPFFLLGINNIPFGELATGNVQLEDAFGQSGEVLALIMTILTASGLLTYVWLLSMINFVMTKRWYVLLLLLLAPLPIAYVIAGPYHTHILEWMFAM
jgi:hypothetical protein